MPVPPSPSPEPSTSKVLSLHRDPMDVKLLLSLTTTLLVALLLLTSSMGLNVWLWYRKPDRIVVDKSSGRVVEINDRSYGQTDAVSLGPDHLTKEDKLYLSEEFAKAIFQIDPATRPNDIKRALYMMVPVSATSFHAELKRTRTLETQRQESWQSTWQTQEIGLDERDQYVVRILGEQKLRKVISGQPVEETHQLRLTLRLSADPQGRANRNLRSGFLIFGCDYKDVPKTA